MLWLDALRPFNRFWEVGIGGLGFACGYVGLALALLCAPAILLQIRLGDVGREPGCPSCCRCCCGSATPRGAKKALQVDGVSVRVDSANLIGV